MKTMFLLLCAVFGMNMANAQYYFYTYGSFPDFQTCNSGITTIGTPGYMLVGWQFAVGGFQSSNVVWTDLAGSPATPYFNKTFTLNVSGVNYSSRATRVIENSVNMHFYVVGWVEMTGVHYPYLMELDNTGVFVSCTVYPFANSNGIDMVNLTTANNGSGDMYITSTHDYGMGLTSTIVFRVDTLGNAIWANIYDILDSQNQIQAAFARGIVESPWAPQSGIPSSKELYIFGAARAGGATGTLNPTVLIIDGLTGALPPVPVIQHLHGVDASYSSCDVSQAYGGGFVAAGLINNGGINDHNALTTNMQPLGNVNWCTMHDNGPYPGEYNEANGVKERINPNGPQYETYTAGLVYDIATATIQMQALKIDNTGNLINEFLFTSGNSERGMQLDLDPNGDGFAVFGTLGTASTGNDMFTAKMYFNGVMPLSCSSTTNNFASSSVDVSKVNPLATRTALPLSSFTMNATIGMLGETQHCFVPAFPGVPGGSNAKTTQQPDKNTEGSFNLKQAGQQIAIETPANAQQTDIRYLIRVYDLVGKQVLNTELRIVPGSKDALSLDSYGLKPGYYLFTVTNNGETQTLKVFIGQ